MTALSAGNAISIPSAALTSNTLGFNEPAAGVSSSSFTVTWEPANGVAPHGQSQLSPATAGSSALGSNAAADTLFAQHGLVSHLRTGLLL